MAGDFWEVGQWEETPSGKNRFIKLGYAKEKNGGGFYVNFDALPMPKLDDRGKLRCSVVIQPPKGTYSGQRSEGSIEPANSRLGEQQRQNDNDGVPW